MEKMLTSHFTGLSWFGLGCPSSGNPCRAHLSRGVVKGRFFEKGIFREKDFNAVVLLSLINVCFNYLISILLFYCINTVIRTYTLFL